jgi:hypothetical protein
MSFFSRGKVATLTADLGRKQLSFWDLRLLIHEVSPACMPFGSLCLVPNDDFLLLDATFIQNGWQETDLWSASVEANCRAQLGRLCEPIMGHPLGWRLPY